MTEVPASRFVWELGNVVEEGAFPSLILILRNEPALSASVKPSQCNLPMLWTDENIIAVGVASPLRLFAKTAGSAWSEACGAYVCPLSGINLDRNIPVSVRRMEEISRFFNPHRWNGRLVHTSSCVVVEGMRCSYEGV